MDGGTHQPLISQAGALATAMFVGAWGMAKGHVGGWGLAFFIDVGLFVMLLTALIDDGLSRVDWDLFRLTAVPSCRREGYGFLLYDSFRGTGRNGRRCRDKANA